MSNFNNWSRRDRGGRGGGRGKGNRRSGPDQRRNDRRERNFPKFSDNEFNNYNNDDNYWPQKHRNYNNNGFNANGRYPNNDGGGDIVPWHRKTPIIPLIIPPLHNNDELEEDETNNDEVNKQHAQEGTADNLNNSFISEKSLNNIGTSDARNRNTSLSKNNTAAVSAETSNTPVKVNPLTVQIKQEKQDVMKLKQEKKSSSSSSSSSESSSSESSSSEEEAEVPTKLLASNAANVKNSKESPVMVTPSSPLNIKLKPKCNSTIAPPTLKNTVTTAPPSSSSSAEEEEEPPKPPPPSTKASKTKSQKQESKTKSSKKKENLEDDVVCMGNLENKIVLEDDSEEEEESQEESVVTSSASKTSKKSSKKTEICMICDKKGHTSFQCQMICKNCSAPYHGFRNCSQPANLNTMMQLFLEFCMQQFQHFTGAKDLNINTTETVPRPQVDSPSANIANKTRKLKRKQAKSTETKSTKKRKLSIGSKKKLFKEDSDDDEDNESDASEPEEEATDSDDTSSSESLVSSKKKQKLKNKSFTKIPFTIPNFTPNPVNLPMVLNGFPNLTTGAATVTNPSNSNNALNTLLLTQMFQNAIGSLNK